jgi:hypothetical protein
MLLPAVLAAWIMASPPTETAAEVLPKVALFHAVPLARTRSAGELADLAAPSSRAKADAMWGWLDQLAVVRPHRGDRRASPSLQMFIALSVVKGQVGLRAFGSF